MNMTLARKINLFASLLGLVLIGCASNSKVSEISEVEVAGYKDSDAAAAEKLTFGILHDHGIMAGGAGNAGWMNVEVPPNQVSEAHKILENESAGLNQKERDSFDIVWRWQRGTNSELDFLKDIPSLRGVKPNMSETDFLTILKGQNLDYNKITSIGQTMYYVKPATRELVFVGFKDGHCFLVGRMSG